MTAPTATAPAAQVGDWARGFDGYRWHLGRVTDPTHPRGVEVDEPGFGRAVRRDVRVIDDREAAVDLLLVRYERLVDAADSLDDDYDGDLAGRAVAAVDEAWRSPDEDDALTSVVRFACYVAALTDAVEEARDDYTDAPAPRRSPSSWADEAFPKAVLGL